MLRSSSPTPLRPFLCKQSSAVHASDAHLMHAPYDMQSTARVEMPQVAQTGAMAAAM